MAQSQATHQRNYQHLHERTKNFPFKLPEYCSIIQAELIPGNEIADEITKSTIRFTTEPVQEIRKPL